MLLDKGVKKFQEKATKFFKGELLVSPSRIDSLINDENEDEGVWGKKPKRVLLVVIVGGVTFAEVSALRYVAKQRKGELMSHSLGVKVVVATTQMLNGKKAVSQMVEGALPATTIYENKWDKIWKENHLNNKEKIPLFLFLHVSVSSSSLNSPNYKVYHSNLRMTPDCLKLRNVNRQWIVLTPVIPYLYSSSPLFACGLHSGWLRARLKTTHCSPGINHFQLPSHAFITPSTKEKKPLLI